MIHQLVHTLNYGDAISGEVLALHRIFNNQGIKSEIYCINTHPKYKGLTKDYRDFDNSFMGEVILHYSLGSPLNPLYRSLHIAKRTLIYHNITPSEWYSGVNPRIVKDIEDGVRELPDLLKISDKILSDSLSNAEDIRKIGFKSEVLPLMFDPNRWDMASNPGFNDLLKKDKAINLLHVGRIAPNKCIEDIIKIFYFYHHHVEKNSRLWLPGIDIDTELYSFSLKRMVHEFNLTGYVEFCGGRSDDELRSLYEGCDVYLCMSEHEGFCMPVIEAMNFGLPVISYNAGALPDTVGNGGILINDKDPLRIACLIDSIIQSAEIKKDLIAAGKTHVEKFSFSNFEERVRRFF